MIYPQAYRHCLRKKVTTSIISLCCGFYDSKSAVYVLIAASERHFIIPKWRCICYFSSQHFFSLWVSVWLTVLLAHRLGFSLIVGMHVRILSGINMQALAYNRPEVEMSQYISNWMEQNGSSANCASLGFAQCYLQWHVCAHNTSVISQTETDLFTD